MLSAMAPGRWRRGVGGFPARTCHAWARSPCCPQVPWASACARRHRAELIVAVVAIGAIGSGCGFINVRVHLVAAGARARGDAWPADEPVMLGSLAWRPSAARSPERSSTSGRPAMFTWPAPLSWSASLAGFASGLPGRMAYAPVDEARPHDAHGGGPGRRGHRPRQGVREGPPHPSGSGCAASRTIGSGSAPSTASTCTSSAARSSACWGRTAPARPPP